MWHQILSYQQAQAMLWGLMILFRSVLLVSKQRIMVHHPSAF